MPESIKKYLFSNYVEITRLWYYGQLNFESYGTITPILNSLKEYNVDAGFMYLFKYGDTVLVAITEMVYHFVDNDLVKIIGPDITSSSIKHYIRVIKINKILNR